MAWWAALAKMAPQIMGAAGSMGGGGKGGDKKGGGGLGDLKSKTPSGRMGGGTMAAGAIGGIQAITGAIQQRKADRMLPAQEDPEMRAAMTQAKRRARAFQTGTALAGERAALAQQLGTGQQRMMRYGGGRKGLLQMQQAFNQGITGLAKEGIVGQTAAQAQANTILEGISQRKLDLQMQRHDIAQARAAQRKAAANRNLGLFMGKALSTPSSGGQSMDLGGLTKAISGMGGAGSGQPDMATAPISPNPASRSSSAPLPTPDQDFTKALGGVQGNMAGAAKAGQAAAGVFKALGTGF